MTNTQGRKCAICGKTQSPKLGGLIPFAAAISKLKDIKLADANSGYAHLKCMNNTRKAKCLN